MSLPETRRLRSAPSCTAVPARAERPPAGDRIARTAGIALIRRRPDRATTPFTRQTGGV
jgi:hypothetical protein